MNENSTSYHGHRFSIFKTLLSSLNKVFVRRLGSDASRGYIHIWLAIFLAMAEFVPGSASLPSSEVELTISCR